MEEAGAHIASLLIRIMVMYYPQLIAAGMVYKAIPPLYSIPKGKKKMYFAENIDMIHYVQKAFQSQYTVEYMNGNKVSPKDLTVFFLKNADYLYHLENVASTYAIPLDLLEMVLYHYIENKNKFNFKNLDKDIRKKYRFMTENQKIGDTIKIQGSIAEKHIFFINDKFINECRFILHLIRENETINYKLNGLKCTIGDIMSAYATVEPKGVQRYKGLGEMDADELAESTLYPGSDRTLIRYTLEDASNEIETIRRYESNPKLILNHVGNVTRDDLLD